MTRTIRWWDGAAGIYLIYAVATLVHNLYLRFIGGTETCTNIGCLESMGETVVWSLLWPIYWPAYLGHL